jgi:hypothetical protein
VTGRRLLVLTLRLAVPLYLASLAVALVGTALVTAGLATAGGGRTWLPDLLGSGWLNTVTELLLSLRPGSSPDRQAIASLALGSLLGAPVLLVLQWMAYTLVSGGILDRLLFGESRKEAPPFWRACRHWFWPFFRLGVVGSVFVAALAGLGGFAALFLAKVVGPTVAFLALSAWVAVLLGWLEVGRAVMAWNGLRNARAVLGRALALVARPWAILLWLFLTLPGAGLLVVAASPPVATTPPTTGTILTTLVLGQVVAFLGAWLKVIRLAAASRLVAGASPHW